MSEQEPHGEDGRTAEPAPTTTVIQAISRRNWIRGLIAFAIALIVLPALGFAAARINETVSRTPAQISLDGIEAAPDARSATTEFVAGGGTATVEWSAELGLAVLHSADLPVIGPDEQFAVWYTEGQTSVLVAEFESDDGPVLVELDSPVDEGVLVAVTVEPAGSAPAQPTGEPLVTIPTS